MDPQRRQDRKVPQSHRIDEPALRSSGVVDLRVGSFFSGMTLKGSENGRPCNKPSVTVVVADFQSARQCR